MTKQPSPSNQEPRPAAISADSLREAARLFAYLLPYKFRFIAALLALFVSSLLGLAFPYLTGKLVDRAIAGPAALQGGLGQSSINGIVAVLIGALALQALLSFFHTIAFAQVGERSLADLRRDTFGRL